ncbi:MAG: hypothetical protein IJ087_16415 [Eggerthellaceae bacterium]|nr:hypothetical protein [Eggerthellaceae bacterium]
MGTAEKINGTRDAREAAEKAALVRLAFAARVLVALAPLLGTALLSAAFTVPAGKALANTAGLVETEGGTAAYADVLASDSPEEVQVVEAAVGDDLRLEGSIEGGWGTVTITWERCDDVAAVSGLMKHGAEADDDLSWQTVSTQSVHDSLLEYNRAVKPGGKTQQLALQVVEPSRAAFRMTASDSAGYRLSQYWAVDALSTQGISTQETARSTVSSEAPTSILVKTADQIINPEKDPANEKTPVDQVTQTSTNPGKADASDMPATGDMLGAGFVVAAVIALLAVCSIVGALLNWRRR